MIQLVQSMHALRATLEAFHPAAPGAILVALVWLSQYLVRRFLPNAWEKMADLPFNGARPAASTLRKVWQALPSIATGAFLTALTGDGSVTDAVLGAVLGALAPVWHEVLKALPVPYVGGKPPAADPVAGTLKRAYRQEEDLTPAESPIAKSKSDPPPPPPDTWR